MYVGVREMKIHLEKESRHMSRVMRTSIGTMTEVSIRLVEQEKENKKVDAQSSSYCANSLTASSCNRQLLPMFLFSAVQ